MNQTVLQINNLSMSYNGNPVLKNIDMSIHSGTIHGLLGLNGAGKSTLVKILSGIIKPDTGDILLDGQKISFKNPLAAKKAGIITIHQNVPLNLSISVAEYMYMNVSVVAKYDEFRFHSFPSMSTECKRIFDSLCIDLDPSMPLKSLSIGQRQMMQIATSIALKPKVLLLDEPYSMLNSLERSSLSLLFKRLCEAEAALVLVTHEMGEAINSCDELSILKDGHLSKFLNTNATREELIEAIVDKNQKYTYPYIPRKTSRTTLSANNISTQKLKNVSFTLKKGEILGVAGLLGAGKTSLARTLFGVYHIKAGDLFMDGSLLKLKNPSDAIKNKICLLPEDLLSEGILEAFSVKKNISLPNLKDVSCFRFLNYGRERRVANRFIKKYVIRTRSAQELTRELSAGNKQKVGISKWVFSSSSILIMDDPTQTVDIPSRVEIYNFMNKYCLEGGSILFISSDFEELMGMCDRILIMREGEIIQTLERNEFSNDKIVNILSN